MKVSTSSPSPTWSCHSKYFLFCQYLKRKALQPWSLSSRRRCLTSIQVVSAIKILQYIEVAWGRIVDRHGFGYVLNRASNYTLYIRRAFFLQARTGVIAMVKGMLIVSLEISRIHATQRLAGADHSRGASQPFVPQIDRLGYDYHKWVTITSCLTTR